jgi:fructose-specific phosphotransferase system IIA component
MLMIVMHNKRSYLESLVTIAKKQGITDTIIIEKKNIGASLVGDATSFVFHKGGLVDEYDKAFIAILKEGDSKPFLDIIERDASLNLSNSNDKGFICSIPFQKIKNIGIESYHSKRITRSISEYFEKDRMSLDVKAADKIEAIKEIAALMDGAEEIVDYEVFLNDILDREKIASTAISNEIAIPHARSEAVKDITIAFGRSKDGIDFGASDGKKVKLVFLVGTPKGANVNEYLKVLADISKNLQKEKFKEALLNAISPEEIIRIFFYADTFEMNKSSQFAI